MQRFKIGPVLVALGAAITLFATMFAAPAAAMSSCDAGMSPAFFGSDSGLQLVHCDIDAGVNVSRFATHDAKDVMWHHGAARNVTLVGSPSAITAGSVTIKFAAGAIHDVDVRRPISAFNAAGSSMFKGGTFVYSVSPAGCTSTCTQAVLSQKAVLTGGTSSAPITAKIEHTYNRVVVDGGCAAGTNTLTSASAKFVPSDLGKSVTGGPMATGTYITGVAGTTVTLNQLHTNGCTPQNPYPGAVITIGAWTYVGGIPQVFNGDALTKRLSNTAGGGTGFTCSGSVLTMTAGAKADTGGFVSGDVLLKAVVKGTTTVTGTISSVNLSGNTSASIFPTTCPTGITATAGTATIGILNAKAPRDNNMMSNFSIHAVVNPSLIVSAQDCTVGSYMTIMFSGSWANPGNNYLASTSTPPVSVAQVRFVTSVLSFPGFVVPKRGTDAVDAIDPHYDLSIPVLPTTLVNCLTGGVPTNSYTLGLSNAAVSPFTPPALPALSGNPGDPNLRILLPLNGTYSQTVEAFGDPNSPFTDPTPCTVVVFACP